ncbi:MAG TPA: S8 family serine peptidase [Phycisphaerales bacterium]|nr:S8 family serine peptidase [Phycisphaerales bacterium]
MTNRVAAAPPTARARACAFVLACGLAVGGLQASASAQVQWRSGPAEFPARLKAEQLAPVLAELSKDSARRHVVVYFSRPVLDDERAALAAAGVELQTYLGANAYFARLAAVVQADAAVLAAPLVAATPIHPDHKLHPVLLAGSIPMIALGQAKLDGIAVVDDGVRLADLRAAGLDPQVAVYVQLHPDVAPAQAEAVARAHGGFVRSTAFTVNTAVVHLPASALTALAADDSVLWIEPPLPPLGPNNDSNRARVGANTLQAAPYGLDGTGIKAMVYDAGRMEGHVGFGTRLSYGDTAGFHSHATHVGGTIGSSGAPTAGNTHRGMAPNVQFVSFAFQAALVQGFLYSDPGDLEADYSSGINTHDADIANNSIGSNVESNGYACFMQGDYGVTDALIDGIVRGSLGRPFRIVWANGNERQGSRCNVEGFGQYYSIAPPAAAKNHVTVGALNSNDDSMTSFSSWGPTEDGRLKPDISAPGCESGGDGGVTSTVSTTGFDSYCGTSMASPTVCGIGALMLQDYRANFPGQPDFRNSSLKTFLAHSAHDVEAVGPDYKTGYGSVRAVNAVELVRSGNWTEGTVAQGQLYRATVVVNPGDAQLKATLAWDDAPGTPVTIPSLVNDLDLIVRSPSGVRHYPWTLNPTNPSAAAVQTAEDHRNNLEQVVVNNPEPGGWTIEVSGTTVPQGPQVFSLVATPYFVNCSSSGLVSLSNTQFPCSAQATLRVVDCDLNLSDTALDTVQVTLSSTSEPAGEVVTLTEVAPQAATFIASFPLSSGPGAGALQVAHGDTITLAYTDASDGQGGSNILLTATATVDCLPPVISGVTVPVLEPRAATVALTASEPVRATVRYGLACGALDTTAESLQLSGSPSVDLTSLVDDTSYFFVVEATDAAGNLAVDNNGGACFSLTTPEVPDFFTEEFGSDNDLDNKSFRFTPNGSNDFYAACRQAITGLPTSPTGGTLLTLSDDSYSQVTLTGGATVSLYGQTYSTFWVGSNGYITFDTASTDYTESLTEHFAQARISALYDDLNPGSGGQVSWRQLSDRVAITWLNVPEYGTTNQNTLQIELFFDGRIVVSYLAVAALDGIAGLSAGTGLDVDFLETDLANLALCPPPAPVPPLASDVTAVVARSQLVNVQLSATDDGQPGPTLSYIVTSLPASGVLSDPGAGPIVSVPYTLVGGGQVVRYTASAAPGIVSFTYVASDGGTPPGGGNSNTATVLVKVAAYAFMLDTDPGFLREGQWAYGAPTGAGDPPAGFTGGSVFGYNLAGNYANNLNPPRYLTTPALDLTGVSNTRLEYRRWLQIQSATFDHASVQLSTNGTTWTTIWDFTGPTLQETAWSLQAHDISSLADGQASVRIRWAMGVTNSSTNYTGWNLDDIVIYGEASAPACPSDINQDGAVTTADVSTFLTRWFADISGGTLTADFDGNGVTNTSDITAFLSAWFAAIAAGGC